MVQGSRVGGYINQARIWFTQAFREIEADRLQRIALLALAIVLQGALDLPRDALRAAVGPKIGLLTMSVQLASLALAAYAIIAPRLLRPRPTTPLLATIALVLACAAGIIGVRQVGLMVVSSFTHTTYVNDGTTLDHDAALELLHGHDPYQQVTLNGAVAALGQSTQYATPLRRGSFADRSWLDYPTATEISAVLAAATDPSRAPPEVESRVSYPALAFLALVPFVAVGLPSVILFSVLCLGLLAWLALRAVEPALRPWVGLLILSDTPLLNSALTGALDVAAVLLLLLAWVRWRDGVWSAVFLGLAIATKQQPWFFVPFYAIFIAQRTGWRDALTRLVGAAGLFFAINAPFILHDGHAWLASVLAPVTDPMFPRGQGIVQLALAGVLPLWPQRVYTTLEVLALVAAIGWYWWRGARRHPALVFLLALLPLWFAWRSLPSYFAFSALPMLTLFFAWDWEGRDPQAAQSRSLTFQENFLAVRDAVSLRVLPRLRDMRGTAFLTPTTIWLLWGATSLLLLLNLIIGQHYCDPQFYQYAGDFAVGRLPYQSVDVEYPPLAIIIMLIPALPLLPFAGIAPRPNGLAHPLQHDLDAVRYGAYGISFGLCMLLLSGLTLWLVMRAARHHVPGDRQGVWSGLISVGLIFGSGAVLQKFDLAVGTLCLVAVLALLDDHDGWAWAALVAAVLVKGFPILLAPIFLLWRIDIPLPLNRQTVRIDWSALRRAAIGGGIAVAALVGPVVVSSGFAPLLHSVAYHTERGIEIESVLASVVLLAGWLPHLGVTTSFSFTDLSRNVHSPLVGPLDALGTPVLLVLVVAIYVAFWYNGRGKDAASRQPSVFVAASALLLAFMLTFRALPLHYLLAVVPLAALVRLPSRTQGRWLAALVGMCILGQIVISSWHHLVLLEPLFVVVLIARNICWLVAEGILIATLAPRTLWKEVTDGCRAVFVARRG